MLPKTRSSASLLQETSNTQGVPPIQATRQNPETIEAPQRQHAVTCRQCGHSITANKWLHCKAGAVESTFRNPAGYSFHVITFSQAPGAQATGPSTLEASWFEGHRWTIATCQNCFVHLGWHFDGPEQFWGLIATRLVGLQIS